MNDKPKRPLPLPGMDIPRPESMPERKSSHPVVRLVFSLIDTLIRVAVIQAYWNWFMVPLGAGHLPFKTLLGVVVLVETLLAEHIISYLAMLSPGGYAVVRLVNTVRAIVTSGMLYLFGWIIFQLL